MNKSMVDQTLHQFSAGITSAIEMTIVVIASLEQLGVDDYIDYGSFYGSRFGLVA